MEVVGFDQADSARAFALRREVDERVRERDRAVAVGEHAERLLHVRVRIEAHAVDRADEREHEPRARAQRAELVAHRGRAAARERDVDERVAARRRLVRERRRAAEV